MAKDPACLFYIDKWLVATKEMKADCRGWFLNLILHQFDKGDLPNEVEELANLADVRISEYDRFKQEFEQVLKHKFKQKGNGRLENEYAKEIMKSREIFKEKRGEAGKMSYLLKYIRKNLSKDENLIFFLKKKINFSDPEANFFIDVKNEHMIKQVFKQISELYINVNKNVNVNSNEDKEGGVGEIEIFVEEKDHAEEMPVRYHVGAEPVYDLKEYLEANYSILMNDLKIQHGELKFQSGLKNFEQRNIQKSWKDGQDLRHHFTNFLIKHSENHGKNWQNIGDKKFLGSTNTVNTGKEMGKF